MTKYLKKKTRPILSEHQKLADQMQESPPQIIIDDFNKDPLVKSGNIERLIASAQSSDRVPPFYNQFVAIDIGYYLFITGHRKISKNIKIYTSLLLLEGFAPLPRQGFAMDPLGVPKQLQSSFYCPYPRPEISEYANINRDDKLNRGNNEDFEILQILKVYTRIIVIFFNQLSP